jgi:hypothetical protein
VVNTHGFSNYKMVFLHRTQNACFASERLKLKVINFSLAKQASVHPRQSLLVCPLWGQHTNNKQISSPSLALALPAKQGWQPSQGKGLPPMGPAIKTFRTKDFLSN